jgi:hypothetical protein
MSIRHNKLRTLTSRKYLKQDNYKYNVTDFHGGGKTRSLVCYNEKNVVPKQLQAHVVDWYHTIICHPGINITNYVQACPTCQKNKRKVKKYGHSPPKEGS